MFGFLLRVVMFIFVIFVIIPAVDKKLKITTTFKSVADQVKNLTK